MDTPTPVSEPANRRFVGNLSFRTTDQDLGQAFSGSGEIKSALVITRGRRSLGYGFVVFANATDAEIAVEKHKNLKILDREVKLELAKNRDNIKPREERERGPNNNSGENQNHQQGNNNNSNNSDSNQDQLPQKRRPRNRNRNRNRTSGGPKNQNLHGYGNSFNQFQSNYSPNNFNQPFPSNNGNSRTYGSVVSGFNNFNSFPQNNFNQPFAGNNRNRRGNRPNQGQSINNNSNSNANNNFDDNFNNGRRQRRRNQGAQDNTQQRTENNINNRQNNQTRTRPEPREKIPSTTTLYITNLPFSCTDDGLFEIFKDCKPKSAHIVFTRNGRSRGYGFVEFEDESSQKKAMEAKNNVDVPDGTNSQRTIQVSVSHSTGKLTDNDGQDH